MAARKIQRKSTLDDLSQIIIALSKYENTIPVDEVRTLITAISTYFRLFLTTEGCADSEVRAIITKFRDAGRRSAPWKPASARVPGRPQDGEDGNRRARWLFPTEHKFYADEVNATLVEVKYFLQTLSMSGAPSMPAGSFQSNFHWLLGHEVAPGAYLDPIQLIPIEFVNFLKNRTFVQSGHLVPLDRGGRHIPSNTFLMLARSNQLQGNQTLDELIELMSQIVTRHASKHQLT